MEKVMPCELFGAEISFVQLNGGTQVGGKSAFTVGADECNGPPGMRIAREQQRPDSIPDKLVVKDLPVIVSADLPDKACCHSQPGKARNGIGGRTPGSEGGFHVLANLPDSV